MKINPSRLLFFSLVLLLMFAGCSTGNGSKSNNKGNSCTSNNQCSSGQVCQNGSCVAPSNSVPQAPTNLSATPGNTQATLSWSASSGAWGYNIYQSMTSGSPYTKVGSTTNTNDTVTGLTNGLSYYFVVTATNKAGESGYSNETQAILNLLAPINLTAIAGNAQVTLNWNASSGATSYNIYQSMTSGGPYTKVGSTTNTNDTVTGLTNGLSYYFIVTALNSTEETGYSNQAGATLITGSPTNLTATAATGQLSLAWNATIGATSYNVYTTTTSGGPYSLVGITTTTGYTVTGLTNGTEYYFVVTAVNAGGESGYSNQVNAIPMLPPSNLTAIAGNAQVALNWSASSGATSYNVYTATTSGGPYSAVETTTTTNYTVTGLTNGTEYYFVVTAVNAGGESGYSNQVIATPLLPPSNLTAIAGNAQVTLNWNASSGATSYNIYQSMTSGGPYTKVGSTTNTNDTVTGLTNGLSYYFVITAIYIGGESGYSNQAGATLIAGSPTSLIATLANGNGSVSLSWNTTIGGTSYNIYEAATSGGPYSKVNSSINAYYTVTGLTNGVKYYFVVTAINAGGESGYSNEISVIPFPTFAVGSGPWGIAIDNLGNIWVADSSDNTLTELYSTGAIRGTVPLGGDAWNIAISAGGWIIVPEGASGIVNSFCELPGNYHYSQTTLWSGVVPIGVAIDSSGNIWLTDPNTKSVIENYLSYEAYPVSSSPYGIAIDGSGNVWVSYPGANSVAELTSGGITVGTYTVGNYPKDIAIDSAGNIWVTNWNSNTVTELSSTGSTIGTYAVGSFPWGIAIDGSGNVWVANYYGNSVTELNITGTTIATYTVGTKPRGIAIDSSGNVWVTNSGSNNVTELTGLTNGPQYWPYTGPQWP